MARKNRKKMFRDVNIYYRDENKVWRKVENVKVALEYDKPQTIYRTDEAGRNEQLYLRNE